MSLWDAYQSLSTGQQLGVCLNAPLVVCTTLAVAVGIVRVILAETLASRAVRYPRHLV